jgi:hypothetical protein
MRPSKNPNLSDAERRRLYRNRVDELYNEYFPQQKSEPRRLENCQEAVINGLTFAILLPRGFAQALDLNQGDFIRTVRDGKRLVIEKSDSKEFRSVE